ncbi:Na+/H+ antiporter subunit E [Amnibacterium kyonggiense]|uniref:Multisubunit sodium/proton antiporter MrpE subunit n=1 Tax=Amnibacterium kyonggiense TaxID=595671 RepID=A0A4V3EAR9_9MICO|nr:Na+/H+ antiporter subunit E [Amnibacterium kyonggiense]TDS77684.1 multisubunit sodium/proton antiporter MrpE subunit [Amnibacterium kyonggiense]
MTDASRKRAGRWTTGPPLVIGLVVLWLLLWRSVAPLTILTGVVTALLVVRIFDLPPVPHVGRFRPLAALALLGWFLGQVVIASVQVAAQAVAALSPSRRPRSGVIAVQLRTRDDLVLTLTGIVTSLIPGTVIVEVDRAESVLYLHVLRGGTPERLEQARDSALIAERRLVRAIGSPGEQEVVR